MTGRPQTRLTLNVVANSGPGIAIVLFVFDVTPRGQAQLYHFTFHVDFDADNKYCDTISDEYPQDLLASFNK
ncbi:hypothetical protein X777_04278 [Ooceraea biroi]|uniref:Uncharacterized protein n=1 Tax=Ooceraea biroi TaxID=2015173 RepID=A0A026WK53_OOCBI|nr:hypothetical protein X777_04278 [Ooceraea biroi]